MRNAPRRILDDGRTTRPLLPMELYYLITPWAAEPQIEHLLVGRILQILYDNSVLTHDDLKGRSWSPATQFNLSWSLCPTPNIIRYGIPPSFRIDCRSPTWRE